MELKTTKPNKNLTMKTLITTLLAAFVMSSANAEIYNFKGFTLETMQSNPALFVTKAQEFGGTVTENGTGYKATFTNFSLGGVKIDQIEFNQAKDGVGWFWIRSVSGQGRSLHDALKMRFGLPDASSRKESLWNSDYNQQFTFEYSNYGAGDIVVKYYPDRVMPNVSDF
tara:strand:+ start:2034 stop:2540 length:507 start_codon:yes stop_codon:yes gene_type:complete